MHFSMDQYVNTFPLEFTSLSVSIPEFHKGDQLFIKLSIFISTLNILALVVRFSDYINAVSQTLFKCF